jgi:HPt (histidine-containing phosphotransfer) domain-containing protein
MTQNNDFSKRVKTEPLVRCSDTPESIPCWTLPEELREFEQVDGRSAFLADLIECFLTDTGERLQILRQAVSAADFPTLSKQFHTLKGSAGSIGAYDVAGLCREAEEQVRSGLKMDYSRTLAAIEAALTHVRAAMLAYVDLARQPLGVPPANRQR